MKIFLKGGRRPVKLYPLSGSNLFEPLDLMARSIGKDFFSNKSRLMASAGFVDLIPADACFEYKLRL
ncbi:hypothetical protein HDC90_004140 [Pedobacter sp. AK013]|nr:hypothetical protein [Pedobacter sp. AK013]